MAKSSSKSKQAYQTMYKSTSKWKANRARRLTKALKAHPNNTEIQAALGNLSYRRCTPKTKMWSKTSIATAKLLKKFCGSAPHEIFSSNPQTAAAALQSISGNIAKSSVPAGKVSFALGDIAFNKLTNKTS